MICHNGYDPYKQKRIRDIVQGKPIEIVHQTWDKCPVEDEQWSPYKADGSIEVNGSLCGGTLWKVCPGRMRIESHEIVMDNDIVILRNLPIIEEFLADNKTLILEEPIRYYGRYAKLIPLEDRVNSGLMGYPPGYDFDHKIREVWEDNGRLTHISQEDEQGLLMAVLLEYPNLRVSKNEVCEVMAGDPPRITGDEHGIHFVQSNRCTFHRSWLKYKQTFQETIPFLR
jgi:hypothetical protein